MEHLGVNALFLIPGKVGGSETYLRETLRALLPLLPAACTVFTNRENDAALRAALSTAAAPRGLSFDCLDFAAENRYARIVREQTQLARRVRRAGCDVLWSPGYTACLPAPCPQVVSILDMQYRRFPRDLSPLAWLATHVLVSLAARRCARVATISGFAKREIAALTAAAPDKIDVTPLGASEGFAAASAEPGGEPYVLSVAASYPHKNLPQLVRAFSAVAGKIPHRLRLVGGRGRGEGELAKAIARSPAKDRIDRLDWVGTEELRSLYGGASAFVLPSLYEGFGIPVVEAQRAGVPVVATDRASIPEVGGDGYIAYDPSDDANLSDALLRTLSLDAAAREDLVGRGRANAARFTWRRCAEATLASLRAAADAPRRRAAASSKPKEESRP